MGESEAVVAQSDAMVTLNGGETLDVPINVDAAEVRVMSATIDVIGASSATLILRDGSGGAPLAEITVIADDSKSQPH